MLLFFVEACLKHMLLTPGQFIICGKTAEECAEALGVYIYEAYSPVSSLLVSQKHIVINDQFILQRILEDEMDFELSVGEEHKPIISHCPVCEEIAEQEQQETEEDND